MNLECVWAAAIDFDGLNPEDRKRIAKIGFDRWLDEVAHRQQAQTKNPIAPKPAPTRRRKTCPCGRKFLAKRADATYCSARCRQRASRNGPAVTANENSSLQAPQT